MDASWRHILIDVFEPVLGDQIIAEAAASQSVLEDFGRGDDGFWMRRNWMSYLYKDLSLLVGEPTASPLSRGYCGRGDRRNCAAILEAAFAKGFESVAADLGPDPSEWKYPIVGDDAKLQITFESSGDVAPAAPIPWQNRPTYHLITTYGAPANERAYN